MFGNSSPVRLALDALVREACWSSGSIDLQATALRALAFLGPRNCTALARGERIVVVKLDRIGDFVMVTPFLRELRRARPSAWVTLVTSEAAHPLAARCPYVDAVVTAPRTAPGLRGQLTHWLDWLALAWQKLLPLRPTLALLPRWDVDLYDAYALLRLSGADRRVSYSVKVERTKLARNFGADRLLTLPVSSATGRHEVEKNLHLLGVLGFVVQESRPELWPAADGASLLARLLPGCESHFLVAVCPFSAEEVKDWPLARFFEVVRRFAHRTTVTFVLFVGPEYAHINALPGGRTLPNLVSLAGRLSLDETAALLSRCGLVLTVDTGLMHIAAALQRPLVLVHGLAAAHEPESHYSSLRYGPWQADCTLVAPHEPATGARRIDAVSVEQVVAAVAQRLPTA